MHPCPPRSGPPAPIRHRRAVFALGLALAAAALARPAGAAPPAPLSQQPVAGAQRIARWVRPRLDFGSAAQARRALQAGIELLTPVGSAVPGVLRAAGASVEFQPALPLADCSVYTLRVGAAAGAWQAGFRTRCSHWSHPLQIDDRRTARRPGYGADDVQLAASRGGGALAAWVQGDGRHSAIVSSRLQADTGSWLAPRIVDRRGGGDAELPALATLADGSVLAAWVQQARGHDQLLARRLGSAAHRVWRLDRAGAAAGPSTVRLAGDAAGNAVAVWQQARAGHGAVWAAHWSAASRSWGPARLLEAWPGGDYAPVVAAGGDQRFVVAWERGPAGRESVVASRWTQRGWSAPRRLSAPGVRATRPLLALADEGRVAAAWMQGRGAGRRLALRRMRWPHWAGSTRVVQARGLRGPAVAAALRFDPAGNLAVAWEQQATGPAGYRIEAARWLARSARPAGITRLDPAGLGSAGNPALVADPAGNLVCAWYQQGPQGLQVLAARFDASLARWQPARLLSDPRQTVQASFPVLAVDAAGSVTAAWQQYNNWRDIVVASRLR